MLPSPRSLRLTEPLRRSFSSSAVFALLTILGTMLGGCADKIPAPSPMPGIALTLPSSSLGLAEGDRVSVDVRIVRTGGFAGPVTLGVSGLPSNVIAEVAGNPFTGDIATVDIEVVGSVPVGSYHLTLTATGVGIETRATALELHVVTGTSRSVSVAYCTVAAPRWVAFQDGDGAWSGAQPNVIGTNTTFSHVFTRNRGGIATVTPLEDGALSLLSVFFGTPEELAIAGDTNPLDCNASVAKTLFGNIDGLDTTESALISSGIFLRAPSRQTEPPSFILTGLAAGPQDLLATRTTSTGGAAAVTRVILRRDVDLPDSTRLANLDFNSSEAIVPVTSHVSVHGLGGDGAISGTQLFTTHSRMVLSFLTSQPAAVTRPYFALPASALLPGEVQSLHVATNGPSSPTRSADTYSRSPGDRTVTLGAALVPPTLSAVATTPSLRVRTQFVPQSDYDRSTSINFQQGSTSALVTISMTAAYAAINGAGYDLVVPDLSTVAGFDPAWALRPGVRLIWSATRVGGTLGLGRNAVPSEGMTRRSAFRQDTITVR